MSELPLQGETRGAAVAIKELGDPQTELRARTSSYSRPGQHPELAALRRLASRGTRDHVPLILSVRGDLRIVCSTSRHHGLRRVLPQRSSLSGSPAAMGAAGSAWSQFWSQFTPVRGRPPASACSCSRRPRTVVNAGERRATLLESVLGATPQECESPILRHADLEEYRSWPPTRGCPCWPWAQLMGSIFWLRGAAAGPNRSYCAWSPAPRTALNDVAHAVEACALLFKADHDRPRPAETGPPADPSH
jgi:hypothetical protein